MSPEGVDLIRFTSSDRTVPYPVSAPDPVQTWREWCEVRDHHETERQAIDGAMHARLLAAALEAERERVQELESDNLILTKQRDYEVEQIRQRDKRIAALEAGLRVIAQVPELDHWAGKVARQTLERP